MMHDYNARTIWNRLPFSSLHTKTCCLTRPLLDWNCEYCFLLKPGFQQALTSAFSHFFPPFPPPCASSIVQPSIGRFDDDRCRVNFYLHHMLSKEKPCFYFIWKSRLLELNAMGLIKDVQQEEYNSWIDQAWAKTMLATSSKSAFCRWSQEVNICFAFAQFDLCVWGRLF